MDRNTQRGQMMIELLVLVFFFVGLFILAVGISERGERAQSKYRFQKKSHSYSMRGDR